MKKPNFFIVGFPKCGTTSMYHYLSEHPEIYMSEYKEPNFFDTDWKKEGKSPPNGYLFTKPRDYYKLFSGVKNEKIIGESSTVYIYSRSAYKNIYNFNRKSKILIMVRNPIEMIISLFYQKRYGGFESNDNINDVLKKELASLKLKRSVIDRYYIDLVLFYKHIKKYISLFSENVKVVVFEEFLKNKKKVFSEILEFLDVDTTFVPTFRKYNSRKDVRLDVIRKILIKTNVGKHVYRINRNVYFTLSKFIDKILNKPIKSDTKINKNIRQRILDYLYNDIKKTEKLINKPLRKIWRINKR